MDPNTISVGLNMQDDNSKENEHLKLLIWDEALTIRREYIESVDRYCRELFDPCQPFGGLIVVFAGDPRQTLPKIKNNHSRGVVTDTVFKKLDLYQFFVKHTLKTNMRLKNAKEHGDDYAK